MNRLSTFLAACAVALSLGGCGLNDPYNDPQPQGAATAGDTHAHSDSYDEEVKDSSDPTTAVSDDAPANADAEEIAVAYGLAQTNWSFATYEKQYEKMRKLAGGKLAEELASARPEEDQLAGIKDNRQVNRSSVIAVDTRKASKTEAVIVVAFRETAGSGGALDPVPHHTLHQAKVQKFADGWRVVDWLSLQS